MEEEIKNLMQAVPFQPFVIHVSDGRIFRVPHPDFIHVGRFGRVFLELDEHGLDILQVRQITGVRVDHHGAGSEVAG